MTFRATKSLPGNGPWAVLDACSASSHNTQRAALGRHAGGQKCICPGALKGREERRAYDKVKNGERSRQKKDPLWGYSRFLYMTPNVSIAPMPAELRQAACRSGDGLKYADDGMDRHMTKAGMLKREGAKNWCDLACPVREACLTYVTANEAPRGSWGGVWGGRDPWQRHGLELYLEEGKVKVRDYVEPAANA